MNPPFWEKVLAGRNRYFVSITILDSSESQIPVFWKALSLHFQVLVQRGLSSFDPELTFSVNTKQLLRFQHCFGSICTILILFALWFCTWSLPATASYVSWPVALQEGILPEDSLDWIRYWHFVPASHQALLLGRLYRRNIQANTKIPKGKWLSGKKWHINRKYFMVHAAWFVHSLKWLFQMGKKERPTPYAFISCPRAGTLKRCFHSTSRLKIPGTSWNNWHQKYSIFPGLSQNNNI